MERGWAMELAGKTAFVTGASGGIGSAICRALAAEGANVALCFHSNQEAALDIAKEIQKTGRKAMTFKLDVSDKDAVFSAINMAVVCLGDIDILVNNAGMTMTGSIEEISEKDWDRCMAVNLKGALFTTQAILPSMKRKKKGTIINISSLGAKIGGINAAACYSVSKAGLSCLTIQTAKETLGYGINVNAIAPGIIDTPLHDVYGKQRKIAAYSSVIRGPGRPEDVAAAVIFLASRGASYITGEILDVNGGVLMD